MGSSNVSFRLQNLHHMYRNLGGWTFAFSDYYDANITGDLDNPVMQKMAEIIDPIGMYIPKQVL